MMQTTRSERAATVTEVLVVLAIIGTAAALLLPAVQRARAAARRIQAANQFRQVAIGLSHFAAQHGDRLPSLDGQRAGDPNLGTSPLDAIRSFVEANRTITHVVHGRGVVALPLYISPLDPTYERVTDADGDTSVALNAVLYGVSRQPVSVTDGSSNTISLTEHYAQCGRTGFSWSLIMARCRADEGSTVKQVPCVNSTYHRATFADYPAADDLHPGTPLPARTFQVTPTLDECDYRLPQAAHPTGLLTVMLDGSVRWVKPGVSPVAFWAAVTPNGGETVPLE